MMQKYGRVDGKEVDRVYDVRWRDQHIVRMPSYNYNICYQIRCPNWIHDAGIDGLAAGRTERGCRCTDGIRSGCDAGQCGGHGR